MVFLANNLDDSVYNKLRSIFLEIDVNKNGHIMFDELVNYFNCCKLTHDLEEIKEIFYFLDLNKNGKLEYREFIASNLRKKVANKIFKDLNKETKN